MILVSGGAGYIGSHTVSALHKSGQPIVVVDDLSEGHAEAVAGLPLEQGSTMDRDFLDAVFKKYPIQQVCHFAARCYVGESVENPGLYYRNNVFGTLSLVEAMVAHGVKQIVFSSTCATYGEPEQIPITESNPQQPINPYGFTKLACEHILRDFAVSHGLASVSLRYFNAAGAEPGGNIGEDHEPETHLIPLVLRAAQGKGKPLTVFGRDYDTRDGTCVRDYIHVSDLAQAHVLALQHLAGGAAGAMAFNLGSEQGFTVQEVIDMAEKVTGMSVPHTDGPRRPGDPATLVGSSAKIRETLGWSPQHSDLEAILRSAWDWHRAHPEGYA